MAEGGAGGGEGILKVYPRVYSCVFIRHIIIITSINVYMLKKHRKIKLLAAANLDLEVLINNSAFNFLLKAAEAKKCRRIENNLPLSDELNRYIADFDPKEEKKKWLKPIRLKKLYWIITKIGNRRINDPFCFDGFVKLRSGFLQKNLGTRYANLCLLILEKLGVIISDSQYKYFAGKRCRAFKMREPYFGKKRRIVKDFEFEQRESCDGYDEKPVLKIFGVESPFHQHLLDSLRSTTVSPKAYDYLDSLEFETDTGEIALARLNVIKDKIWQFRIDKYSRVTTNVSSLTHSKVDAKGNKLGLRRFLLLDNEPLIETDLKSSHPFHCLDLYNLSKAAAKTTQAEKEKYAKLFENDFYEFVLEMSGQKLTRNQIKKIWMSEIINRGRPKTKVAKTILTVFEAEFPILVQCMRKIRSRNYKHIAHHLLSIEARLLIHSVGKKVWEKVGAKFLTVHDSILHKEKDKKLIHETIDAVYRQHLGFVPRLNCSGLSLVEKT